MAATCTIRAARVNSSIRVIFVNDSHRDKSSSGSYDRAGARHAGGSECHRRAHAYLLRWRDLAYVAVFYLVVGGGAHLLALVAAAAMLHMRRTRWRKFRRCTWRSRPSARCCCTRRCWVFCGCWCAAAAPRRSGPRWAGAHFPPASSARRHRCAISAHGGALLAVIQIAGRYSAHAVRFAHGQNVSRPAQRADDHGACDSRGAAD